MKRVFSILLLLVTLQAAAQTQTTLPAGSVPFGSVYLASDGSVWAGAAGKTFKKIGLQANISSLNDSITALRTSINGKVDKIIGKGLSTEDYTTAEKSKLAGIAAGAEVNVNADWLAVSGDALILNKPTLTESDPVFLAQKGAVNGVATLNSSGKIPNTQIPALALVDTYVAASQAAMLALSTAEQGDVAIRTDLSKTFILTDANYGTLASWKELLSPVIPAETDPVWGASASAGITAGNVSTWNGKQSALSGTGIVKSTAGIISYLNDPLPIANGGTGSATIPTWNQNTTGYSSSVSLIGSDADAIFYIPRVSINTAGNSVVGVGANSPTINASTGSTSFYGTGRFTSGSSSIPSLVVIGAVAGLNGDGSIQLGPNASANYGIVGGTGYNGIYLKGGGSTSLFLDGAVSGKAFFSGGVSVPTSVESGSVGIGSLSASSRLNVVGTATFADGAQMVVDNVGAWTTTGNGTVSFPSAGVLRTTSNGVAAVYGNQTIGVTVGRRYRLSFTFTNITAGNTYMYIGTAKTAAAGHDAYAGNGGMGNGNYTYYFTPTSETLVLNFGSYNGYSHWSNISVVEDVSLSVANLAGGGDKIVFANSLGKLIPATIGAGLSYSGGVLTATGGAAGTISGSGTAGSLTKFTGASSVGPSIMTEIGSAISVSGTISATNLSGTNTGDQTNISGNAATATNVAWTGVTSRPTALSSFTNDLGNYGGWITGITSGNVITALGYTPAGGTYGTYIPIPSSNVNISTISVQKTMYYRVGNIVTVVGTLVIEPTSVSTVTSTILSLPVSPSPIGSVYDISGYGTVLNSVGVSYNPVSIVADNGSASAQINYRSQTTTSQQLTYSFSYVAL